MNHTPGPWKLDPKLYKGKDGGPHAFHEVAASTKVIWVAKVQTFTDDKGEMLANARLIAAAPDLLAALKGLLADEYFQKRLAATKQDIGTATPWGKCVMYAEAAIERAEPPEAARERGLSSLDKEEDAK